MITETVTKKQFFLIHEPESTSIFLAGLFSLIKFQNIAIPVEK
jgi:hypothetical protein